jgi:signal transduction histidine kinase
MLDKGLEAIKVRSQGLSRFTQSYRKLTGIPRLSLKESNIRDIVDRVLVLLESKLKEREIVLEVSAVDRQVVVDPGLMEHVLINLLLNAIEALAETKEPRIRISTTRDQKGNVCICIGDNGEGMDEATAERIFIPFFTTRKHGSGIGLALTKQILQLHHADIHFTSQKGKGTEFVIVL